MHILILFNMLFSIYTLVKDEVVYVFKLQMYKHEIQPKQPVVHAETYPQVGVKAGCVAPLR